VPNASRADKLRWYFVVEGIRDELSRQADKTFEIWHAQLEISRQAREGTLVQNGAIDLEWASSGIFTQAGEVVRDALDPRFDPVRGTVPPWVRLLHSALASGLVSRFLQWAAVRGGTVLPDAPLVPTAWDSIIGERLMYASDDKARGRISIPANATVAFAEAQLAEFEAFARKVRAVLARARARQARNRGRPVESDAEALRRAGRAFFLLDLKRTPPPRPRPVDVGRQHYDAPAKREHEKQGMYCPCHGAVRADRKRAKAILAAPPQ
jgi:hypothetical protein